jgi:hypothetical protein
MNSFNFNYKFLKSKYFFIKLIIRIFYPLFSPKDNHPIFFVYYIVIKRNNIEIKRIVEKLDSRYMCFPRTKISFQWG